MRPLSLLVYVSFLVLPAPLCFYPVNMVHRFLFHAHTCRNFRQFPAWHLWQLFFVSSLLRLKNILSYYSSRYSNASLKRELVSKTTIFARKHPDVYSCSISQLYFLDSWKYAAASYCYFTPLLLPVFVLSMYQVRKASYLSLMEFVLAVRSLKSLRPYDF